jgi:hypothetical protein
MIVDAGFSVIESSITYSIKGSSSAILNELGMMELLSGKIKEIGIKAINKYLLIV